MYCFKSENMKTHTVGMLLFPNLTLQDFAGPYDVFIRAQGFTVYTVAENTHPIQAEGGVVLQAQYSFEDCPAIDILFVPGGRGITPLLTNSACLSFLKTRADRAEYITAVCTGSLLLAAAGLLSGYKATTHWRSIPLLKMFNVDAVEERVVRDRNRITGGGITAGIDFGLQVTAWIAGEQVARTIQLLLEYSPAPPFNSGTVKTADTLTVHEAVIQTQQLFDARYEIIKKLTGHVGESKSNEIARTHGCA
jgi:cyclohexyl-isocyanide hydratase